MSTPPTRALADKLLGVALFRAPAYADVAADPASTVQAGLIVGGATLAASLIGNAVLGLEPRAMALAAAAALVVELAGWLLGAWLLSVGGRALARLAPGGRPAVIGLLRASGFASLFKVAGVVPWLGLAGSALHVAGLAVALRAVGRLSPARAGTLAVVVGLALIVLQAAGGRLAVSALEWLWAAVRDWIASLPPAP
jgi:hypothetical protein